VGNTHLFGLNTYEISVPSLPPGVVVQDPRVLEYVLRNEDAITKGEFFRQRSWDLFGMYRVLRSTCEQNRAQAVTNWTAIRKNKNKATASSTHTDRSGARKGKRG